MYKYNHAGIGNFGLSIAMMLNESTTELHNCIFKYDHVVVMVTVRAGEELTVYYGRDYERTRRAQGYSLAGNDTLDHDYLDDNDELAVVKLKCETFFKDCGNAPTLCGPACSVENPTHCTVLRSFMRPWRRYRYTHQPGTGMSTTTGQTRQGKIFAKLP